MLSTRGSGSTEDPNNPGENSCVGTEKMKAWLQWVIERMRKWRQQIQTTVLEVWQWRAAIMEENLDEWVWFNMRYITQLYADANDFCRKWKVTMQEGQGMIAKAKFLRRWDNMSFCDAMHSGEVVQYGHRDCWNDVTSGKIEADRTRCRKIRQTSANCFYFLSEFINRTKVISWEWS